MRKEYGKALRARFESLLAEHLPRFGPLGTKSDFLFPGERAYVAKADGAWLVIVLAPSLKGQNAFHIEIGWSRLLRFPELSMRPSMDIEQTEDRAEFAAEEAMYRLPLGARIDQRWLIETETLDIDRLLADLDARIDAETARSRVHPVVEAAFEELRTNGMAYLAAFEATLGER